MQAISAAVYDLHAEEQQRVIDALVAAGHLPAWIAKLPHSFWGTQK